MTAAGSPPRQTAAYLRKWFSEVGFTLDPRRGQNFLVDLNILDVLLAAAAIRPDDVVLEVGCGTGSLTARLAPLAARVVAAEIDPRLAQLARDSLVEADNVELVEGDVLARKHAIAPEVLAAIDRARAASPSGRFLLVANLPYCVATPVISNLLALERPFDQAVVTVQKEMAERIAAVPRTGDYSGLSVWVQAQCTATIERPLPPSVFWPRPKVDSAILRVDLDRERRERIEDLPGFQAFVRDVFCHRRKALKGVLVRMAGGKQNPSAKAAIDVLFDEMQFEPGIRAEEIPPDRFVELHHTFRRLTGSHP